MKLYIHSLFSYLLPIPRLVSKRVIAIFIGKQDTFGSFKHKREL